jgi:A/G-specific adenine glycosylase
MEKGTEGISSLLISWYEANRRELPWRQTRDPYLIWVSEIILQQTRVAQGEAYYRRFVERFPDLRSLAEADEDEVLKLWEGLGYYSRARHLHRAAREVMERFGGRIPSGEAALRSLEGVGEYTAAAIASFAWNLPRPAVDGNAYRVLSRLFAIEEPVDTGAGRKAVAALAAAVMDKQRAGLHNQALMDFGALLCTPHSPACHACPLCGRCLAYAEGKPEAYPRKAHKVHLRTRYFNYLQFCCGGRTWIRRRPAGDIWQGLYEFPLIETPSVLDFEALCAGEDFRRLTADAGSLELRLALPDLRQTLTHQRLHAAFYVLEIGQPTEALRTAFLEIPLADLAGYAFPRLLRTALGT